VAEDDAYRQIWETEAADDHVRSAIASGGEETVEALTAKVTPIWETLPEGAHYGTILDLGCGYGRIALHLGLNRGITTDRYVGADISQGMLDHLASYRDRHSLWPEAQVELVRTSIDALPLEDASVDLAVSSAVFLHMGDRFVRGALAEVARVLKPEGRFIFEASFPNRHNPGNLPWVLAGFRERRPNQVKFRSRADVRRLLRDSGLERRFSYAIEPASYALLPKGLVPGARRVNALVSGRRLFAESFNVRSV
jgi:ubiquinone/menaquinone biosynthesis C-methylase UbiE